MWFCELRIKYFSVNKSHRNIREPPNVWVHFYLKSRTVAMEWTLESGWIHTAHWIQLYIIRACGMTFSILFLTDEWARKTMGSFKLKSPLVVCDLFFLLFFFTFLKWNKVNGACNFYKFQCCYLFNFFFWCVYQPI